MKEKFNNTVADLIRKGRKKREYSQEYMAAKLGISQPGYSKIESGRSKCSAPMLMEIFELLGFDPPRQMEKNERRFRR